VIKRREAISKKELTEIKCAFVQLIDQFQYLVSENMVNLERKTEELKSLISKAEYLLKLEKKVEPNFSIKDKAFYQKPIVYSRCGQLKTDISESQVIQPLQHSTDKAELCKKIFEMIGEIQKKRGKRPISPPPHLLFENSAQSEQENIRQNFETLMEDYKENIRGGLTHKTEKENNLNEKITRISKIDIVQEPVFHTPRASASEKYKKVIQYYNEGLSFQDIAAKTKIGRGEVELIVGIMKRMGKQNES